MESKSNESDEYGPIESFDDIDDPTYGIIPNTSGIFCHVRELIEYARLKGVSTEELTKEEVAMFEYKVDRPNKFFITDEQKNRLKKILTQEEYDRLIVLTDEAFFDELGGFIDIRVSGGEPTRDGVKLDDIYYEIYNQYD